VAHPEGFKGWITPYDDWPQELKDEYSYNPDKSKELLAAAGYPNGFDTNVVASSDSDLELLEIIKAQFADINVNMDIKTLDSASFRAFGADLKHDQMMWSWNVGMFFIPSDIIRWRESTNTRDNWCLNNDPYYDSLVAQFNACTDLDEAKQIFNEADLYLLQQHWAVAVFPLTNPVLWQPYIKGYSGEFTASGSERGFYGARMWVDQALKESMGR
jgi:peptide/nickel transport system substrate-binding protein